MYRKLLILITKPFTKDRLVSAKDVANLAKLVNKASLVNQENQANLVILATLDSLAWFLLNTVKSQLNHLATHVHQDQLDPQVHQERMAKMEIMVKMAVQAKMVHQAQPVHLAHQAVQDSQEVMDPEVTQAETPPDPNHNPETKVQMDQTENQAQLVQLEMQAKMAVKAQMDPKDHQAQLAMAVKTVNQETKDHQVPMANQEKRVSAPNIVPSMVESSSKMAQGDKHQFSTVLFCNPNAMFLFLSFFTLTSNRH